MKGMQEILGMLIHCAYTTTRLYHFLRKIYQFCEALFKILLKTFFASRIFSIVLQVLCTFIYLNVPILSDVLPDPHPPKIIFVLGPKNRGSWWACTICKAILPNSASNMTKLCEAIWPNFAKQNDQNLRRKSYLVGSAGLPRCCSSRTPCLQSPWKESPAEWPESGPGYTRHIWSQGAMIRNEIGV